MAFFSTKILGGEVMAYDEKIKKKVQNLYEKGVSFKEISAQYKVPAKTVKRWADKYKWFSEKCPEKMSKTKRKVDKICIGKLQKHQRHQTRFVFQILTGGNIGTCRYY